MCPAIGHIGRKPMGKEAKRKSGDDGVPRRQKRNRNCRLNPDALIKDFRKDKQPPIILVYEKAVMKEITRVVKKVMRDCRRWNIPISKRIILDESIHKSPGWYGLTGKTEKGQFLIAFSSIIFVHFRTEVEEALRNIAAHELCHTCPRSMNHGKEWKKWVERLNEHGYRINPKPYSKRDTPGLY